METTQSKDLPPSWQASVHSAASTSAKSDPYERLVSRVENKVKNSTREPAPAVPQPTPAGKSQNPPAVSKPEQSEKHPEPTPGTAVPRPDYSKLTDWRKQLYDCSRPSAAQDKPDPPTPTDIPSTLRVPAVFAVPAQFDTVDNPNREDKMRYELTKLRADKITDPIHGRPSQAQLSQLMGSLGLNPRSMTPAHATR
eukprot:5064268-Pyramimonas_sp.AAC.1